MTAETTAKETDSQDFLSPENKIYSHLLKHQKKYFVSLIILIFFFSAWSNFLVGKPVLGGGESYHLLNLIEKGEYTYNPLVLLLAVIPQNLILIIPLLLSLLSLGLLSKLCEKMELPKNISFFFILFLIMSPTFIYSFITLSSYSLFLSLTLLGFLLIMNKNKTLRLFSLIPFISASFFDTSSAIFLLSLQLIYFWENKEKKEQLPVIVVAMTVGVMLLNKLFLKTPLFNGPYHLQRYFPDLISDFGGLNGIGFFTVLVAITGLFVTWKKKNFYYAYLLLLIVIPGYLFNTEIVFILSLILLFFAAVGFVKLFENKWVLTSLKGFTLIILLLGMIFSMLTFLDRVNELSPSPSDQKVLSWIRENTPENTVVLSAPENSYYVKYFSKRDPLFYLNDPDAEEKTETVQLIFSAPYIQDLFPLLEKNKVSFVYITPQMREELPKEQGFLFLLKNERFKLIYSHEGSEVWEFKKESAENAG
ncbi:MAG: hypothetical protein KKA62_01635 [Nanoarchaeota archaeon]|nr:hypothetical protein [Nanoarchaeota archaeon]MBU1643552.1 hypothetical protein [Nanoarchaeota archaeon]MBU1976634.1 hypothetical protein [Nanoarchaeota archaeon]